MLETSFTPLQIFKSVRNVGRERRWRFGSGPPLPSVIGDGLRARRAYADRGAGAGMAVLGLVELEQQ